MTTVKAKKDGRFWAIHLFKLDLIPYRKVREVAEVIDAALSEQINTPEMDDFLEAVKLEAAHQRERWERTDPHKTDADWYWLIGWLGRKAVTDPHDENETRTLEERRLHRIITVAAAAYNWHQSAKARNRGSKP
jgi:hypothetical protein